MSCNYYDVFDLHKMSQLLQNNNELDLEYTPYESINITYFIILAMNIFNHILISILTITMVYRCWLLDFKKTAMHAHLCTLGFVCFMAEGIMVRCYGNIILRHYAPPSKTALHSVLQFVGGSLGIGGTMQKYWGKEKHFTTAHGKLGVVACVLCAINFVAGVCGLVFPQHMWGMRFFHGFLGLATFIIGMLSQYYGYDTGFFRRNFTHVNLYKAATAAVLTLSAIGPLKILVYKITQMNIGLNKS